MIIMIFSLVRDYCIKACQNEQRLQRAFVDELLLSCESWEQAVIGEHIPRGKECLWYVSNNALQWHISRAYEPGSLAADTTIVGWVLREAALVRSNAARAVRVEELAELAANLSTHEPAQAAEILWCIISFSARTQQEQLQHTRAFLEIMDAIAFANKRDKLVNIEVSSETSYGADS